MHTAVSGLGEYLAEDDRQALGIAREVLARTCHAGLDPASSAARDRAPAWIAGQARNDILELMPTTLREPVDMREVVTHLVDDGFLEFKPLYGPHTVCAQGSIAGHAVGFITNNGPIDVAGANKATHFIQYLCQLGHPIVYLQNTTGYMVGKDSEQGGMIKHGSKMIQAVTNATVPQLTIQCGASFGAGNYGMCGRGYAPRFLFSWPNAKTAVMGGEQAARTMQIVSEAALARKGLTPDPAESQKQFDKIVAMFEAQSDAFYTSGLLLDDGVIDPRDTRAVLAFCLDTIREAQAKQTNAMQFGVARM
jgi:geranyl-CoA carboxylase beta subunit